MITPTFHFAVLEDFMQIFNRQINTMLDKVSAAIGESPGKTMDMFDFVNLMSLDIICGKYQLFT